MDNNMDFSVRGKWDTQLYDFETFDMALDKSCGRVYYAFKSPFGVSDRDFYLQQVLRTDFPEPGQVSLHVASLPPCPEKPNIPGRVRATIHVVAYIVQPLTDLTTGEEVCDIFMLSSVDINGLIPKWVVNMASKNAAREWFTNYTKACKHYAKTETPKWPPKKNDHA